MFIRGKISSFLGFACAILAAIFHRGWAKPTIKDVERLDFKTSTQRLGVRFTDRIRDVFRFRWIKKA
jgi:hypothetical protein